MVSTQKRTVEIVFHGAAGMVTGSCYEIRHPGGAFLVDCGAFQGSKSVRELNYRIFGFSPGDIDFVLLTHAHIDHSGLIPKLCLDGFRGKVHCAPATADLLSFLLPDSGYIHESEVRFLNRRNARRGRAEVDPIYTRKQAESCLKQLRESDYDRWFEPGQGVRVRFWNAGHILGSASIEVEVTDQDGGKLRLLFSGDLGPDEKSFHHAPEAPRDLDYVFMEGTYGDRRRMDITVAGRRENLCREISEGLDLGGNVLIPAFAVERTQELLSDIAVLMREGKLPGVPVFLDSPLAIKATGCFEKHRDQMPELEEGASPFDHPAFKFVETAADSKRLARIAGGAIIMAASGMCDAGRIRHHLKDNLWRSNATVLLAGYQAPGTLGSLLRDGRDKVRIHGEEIAVKARIRMLENYSAHADQQELAAWARARLPIDNGLFLTHGDKAALMVLSQKLRSGEGWEGPIHVPGLGDRFDLSRGHFIKSTAGFGAQDRQSDNLDWHNDYAALLMRLPERLRRMKSDEQRRQLLARIGNILDDSKAEGKWTDG